MLPALHYCFLLLNVQESCYLESRCEKHKEQLDRPAGIKSIQLLGLLFVRREEKGERLLKCSKACKEKKKSESKTIREEKICKTDNFRN